MAFSLGKKIVLLMAVFAVLLIGVAAFMSYNVIGSMNEENFLSKANEFAAVLAHGIDTSSAEELVEEVKSIYEASETRVTSEEWGSPEFEAYVGQFEHLVSTPAYKKVYQQVHDLQETISVDCLYLTFVDPVNDHVVYVVDTDDADPCPVGCIDPLYAINYGVKDDPLRGFPAYITNTSEYGWLVTAAAPVVNEDGQVICYASDDISMDYVKQLESNYVTGLTIGLSLLTVLLCVITAFVIRRFVSRPLRILAEAASHYRNPETGTKPTFSTLGFHTGDEIEELHASMVQMENDIETYIDSLVQTQEELKDTRTEAAQFNMLAHRDALTGVHNRRSYDHAVFVLEQDIANGEAEFGIAVIDLNDLKLINDGYGHKCGDVSLRQLSSLIGSVFVHSPVYRVGGDEFAVILEDNDYEKVQELVDEFNAKMEDLTSGGSEELEPWERISAAIGYALYDKELDSDAEGVFRRADRQMYLRKKVMKGEADVR